MLPFAGQCTRALQDFDGLERFLQDQELIRMTESFDDITPVVIRMGRANDYLEVAVYGPETFDGLETVPAWRHPHVYKGHGIRSAVGNCLFGTMNALLALQRTVDLKSRARGDGRVTAEQQTLGGR